MAKADDWEFWIDTGGTFTDCLGRDPDGRWHRAKVLSSGSIRTSIRKTGTSSLASDLPLEYVEDFFAGFLANFQSAGWQAKIVSYRAREGILILDAPIPSSIEDGDLLELQYEGEAPELGARVITGTPGNERLPSSRLRLATTKGTNALLEKKGADTVLFINQGLGDLLRIGTQQRPDLFAKQIVRPSPLYQRVVEVSVDGSGCELDTASLSGEINALLENGVKTAAICLMHSYQDAAMELELARFLRGSGFETVVASCECAPFINILPRAETTLVDAYLSPVLGDYLDRMVSEFGGEGLSVMTSAGGLVPRTSFRAKDSLFSGPAGGVVGAVNVGIQSGFSKVIGFDMGGTSTDVTRFHDALSYQFETRVGNARILAPSLKIETVAAGGGSICLFDGERLRVGPESAGADPGPACYGSGGPLTVTDVNLLLGRMDASQFGIPIDLAMSSERLDELSSALKTPSTKGKDDLLLAGLLEIANENMTDAIRKISTGEGYDPGEYGLVAFGGAGGQHACSIAEKLGISTILFPADAGLLSASGLCQAVLEGIAERQILCDYEEFTRQVGELSDALVVEALEKLNPEDRESASLVRRVVSIRLEGQESALDVDWRSGEALLDTYEELYQSIFGYAPDLDAVEVVCYRVVVSTPAIVSNRETFPVTIRNPQPLKYQQAFTGGQWCEAGVFNRGEFDVGMRVTGPAVIQDPYSTLFVDLGWTVCVGSCGTLRLDFTGDTSIRSVNTEEVEIELFSNRFQTLVEDMGVRLARTAVSTNVKDRLDFSCGLLDAEGCLVVNAPHIPVHLGALGMCVRTVCKTHSWKPGEMLVTNHPGFGGSHLPDVTLICPLYAESGKLLGFLVNRAHHAEMGGIAPGSMPPTAENLGEEGVVIPPTVIMRQGRLDLSEVVEKLTVGPHPTRRLAENISDLKAQVAANLKGMKDFHELIRTHGSRIICRYMNAIQDRAEKSLRKKLRTLRDGNYTALQKLDDGTSIEVMATVEDENLLLAFSDGGGVHLESFNATPGIVYSAVIYFLRVWLDEPMPLNEGLLRPVKILIPPGLLNPPFPEDPSKCPPVVAGNVETSQRLVDTLFKAFEVMACSQGTMNNLIFGNERISFYETIAGGSGAGEGFRGESGVHVHMTNTGITDPEILESRYPVKLREFSIREGSGGKGAFCGGDGVVRELEFTEPVSCSLLTQHRVEAPYGLRGGQPGQIGEQWLIRENEASLRLRSSDSLDLRAGDRIRILTPGGGGWGVSKE